MRPNALEPPSFRVSSLVREGGLSAWIISNCKETEPKFRSMTKTPTFLLSSTISYGSGPSPRDRSELFRQIGKGHWPSGPTKRRLVNTRISVTDTP